MQITFLSIKNCQTLQSLYGIIYLLNGDIWITQYLLGLSDLVFELTKMASYIYDLTSLA